MKTCHQTCEADNNAAKSGHIMSLINVLYLCIREHRDQTYPLCATAHLQFLSLDRFPFEAE